MATSHHQPAWHRKKWRFTGANIRMGHIMNHGIGMRSQDPQLSDTLHSVPSGKRLQCANLNMAKNSGLTHETGWFSISYVNMYQRVALVAPQNGTVGCLANCSFFKHAGNKFQHLGRHLWLYPHYLTVISQFYIPVEPMIVGLLIKIPWIFIFIFHEGIHTEWILISP